tara:strand:+ start:486 stop:1406 length:921 start_codon:yes stop_codon:yes gene_type:complete
MNMVPKNQTKLYGVNDYLIELINLYNNKKFPNKIILSGQKGIGKCTLAYHLINYILSTGEDNSYDIKNFSINNENRSYKLIQNGSNMNFVLIDVLAEKKNIDISQIRDLISNINKSSFNSKPRIILIDNIELLNNNSINALLKVVEEPNEGIFFILIDNNKNILDTLKSRCLNFRISLSQKISLEIINKLLEADVYDLVSSDLLSYYFTPGQIYNLINLSNKHNIELSELNLDEIILLLINNSFYKKEPSFRIFLYEFIEYYFLTKTTLKDINFYNNFLKKINYVKRFNLDEESLFLEFKSKVLNE